MDSDSNVIEIRHEEVGNGGRFSAWEDGEEVGFLSYDIGARGHVGITNVVVAPEHRRKGIAKEMAFKLSERFPGGTLMEPQFTTQEGKALAHGMWPLYPKGNDQPLSR